MHECQMSFSLLLRCSIKDRTDELIVLKVDCTSSKMPFMNSWTALSLFISFLGWLGYQRRQRMTDIYKNLVMYARFIPYTHLLFSRDKSTFALRSNRKSALITYERNGIVSKIHIPVVRSVKMSGHRAYLISGDHELEITQQPDVPYLVTAEQLGGSEIHVYVDGRRFVFRDNESVVLPADAGRPSLGPVTTGPPAPPPSVVPQVGFQAN